LALSDDIIGLQQRIDPMSPNRSKKTYCVVRFHYVYLSF